MDSSGETATYEILRHPEGGRKDILRWVANGKGANGSEKLTAELEIYRPGGESIGSESVASNLAGLAGEAKQNRRAAAAAGAAAGLAAAFNAPLAATTFVLEEIIGDGRKKSED